MHIPFLGLRARLRTFVLLTTCIALLPLAEISLLVRGRAQGQSQSAGRGGRPTPGKPEGDLPNLEQIRNESNLRRERRAPIPSTIRSPKLSLQPWNGRRVGDPEPPNTEPADKQIRRAHARRRLSSPPPLPDDQFVQNFFSWALLRSPSSDESAYWNDQFRVAYGQGQTSLKLAAIELGKTLFESSEYAARERLNHWYVYDLYKAYLMREPDPAGWTNWENAVSSMGRENVRRGFEESTEFAAIIANVTPNGSASAKAASLISARVDPRNQPGSGLLTRDASWSVPLLSLPGRAGLDLGLALSYSSMVWTRSGPYIYFDEDNGFPSPGFRLGFPTVQMKVFDAQTARNAYLLITGSGKRVELRQVGTSNIYEAADSSYLRLTETGGNLLVYSTDGTRLTLTYSNNEYRCTEIKDRNGNYISINYTAIGRLTNITDTLGRLITFNYDTNDNLVSITQAWSGQPSHQWVSFGWAPRNMQGSFADTSLEGVIAPKNGTTLPVITQVNLNDTSYVTFDYTNSMQVSVIRNYFGVYERNATSFTYEASFGDAPRLTDSRVSARNWTGVNGLPAEVITSYTAASDRSWAQLTAPDGTLYKELFATSGWQTGLTTGTEVWSAGVKKKWTTTSWTQDDTTVSYQKNPRAYDVSIYDEAGNRRRTETVYSSFNLPNPVALATEVKEYAADAATLLRRTTTSYITGQPYIDRRVLGLVRERMVYDGNNNPQSRVWYDYDWGNDTWAETPQPATQHESSSDPSGRGNLCWIGRWDVTDLNNSDKVTRSYIKYNRTGSVIRTEDHLGHGTSISYADSFSDTVDRNTFAYPTTMTDADQFSSYAQYNYDFGASTRTESPAPAGQTQGVIQTMSYNPLGQLERITTTNNGAYKRFWYGSDYVASLATVNNVADELYSVTAVDGLGRVMRVAGNHPGSYGGYRTVNTIYDQMGRAWKVSNPTEVDYAWIASGDDAAGFYYTQQTYDWKGRPLVTTNPDNTTREADYSGCGCAGGEVVTLTDEGTIDGGVPKRRQQKIYSDVLGRTVKTEVLNWQGASVYAATVNTYNARDQIEQIRQYAGPEGSSTYQTTTMTYDGFGRLKSKHVPEQTAGTFTTYTYNPNDTLASVIDARGAATIYGYNNRHLVNSITYSAPSGSNITVPAGVTYEYDGARNRTKMIDGLGQVDYEYDSLSRMTLEKRTFSQTHPLVYTISYGYNLAGQLSSITDPGNKTINYTRDVSGQLLAITGTTFAGVSTYLSALQYRAWGAVKHASYGNGKTLDATYNNRLQAASFQIPAVISKTYDYYADGLLKFSSDAIDHRFDRLYRWDHAGRVKEAYSGAEARGQGLTSDRPYKEFISYDAMGHQTDRTSSFWSFGPGTGSDSYTNNRHDPVGQLWSYDPDGNLLSMPGTAYSYDAGGRLDMAWSDSTVTFGTDGDGKKIKSVEVVWDPVQERDVTTYSFSIYSTVLGRVLRETRTNDDPNSQYAYFNWQTFIYGDNGIIAWQESNGTLTEWIWWDYRDPSNATYRTVGVANSVGQQQELDPYGTNRGTSDWTYQQSIPDEGLLAPYPATNNPSQPNTTYSIDGVRVSLDDFIQNLQIFYHGDLGLNEAIAKESANYRNYQRRWVPGREEDESGRWETTAVSNMPSLTWLISSDQPKRPKVKSASSEQQDRFNNAYDEVWKRIHENDGKNACADLFGGIKNAEKALKNTSFQFGATQNSNAWAQTLGKTITIAPDKPFMDTSGSVTVQVGYNLKLRQRDNIQLDNVQAAAFVLLHELGHRTGTLEPDGNDPFGFVSVINNQKVRDACFSEIPRTSVPL